MPAGWRDAPSTAERSYPSTAAQERYPPVRSVEQLCTRCGRVFTCAGASAILDLMCAWIGRHGEPQPAADVAEHLPIDGPRPAEAPQRVASPRPAANLEEPLSCHEVAARVGLSIRQIARRFLIQFGRTVIQEYLMSRLARADQLLQQTELEVTDISLACGFASAV